MTTSTCSPPWLRCSGNYLGARPVLLIGRRDDDVSCERLTWSLTPHSPAGGVAARLRRQRPSPVGNPSETLIGRVLPSPYAPDNRGLHGQVLLLSRTMLSNHELPYVGRFACDWLRLATTDPHAAHQCSVRPSHPKTQGFDPSVHDVVTHSSWSGNAPAAPERTGRTTWPRAVSSFPGHRCRRGTAGSPGRRPQHRRFSRRPV